ncbi:MAG: NAD(P)-dependent oxidoreductase [Tistlia sp.]|uniref:NAD(P)-dependent oxidoreductase n=1 Tax=Tistlia sp. TaxID=3057121 RepID=UPI0034A1DE86
MTARAARPRIVVTNRAFPETLALLAADGEVVASRESEPLPRARLEAELADAEALLVFMTDLVDEALLAKAPRLKVVGAALKGFDNIDVAACRRRGVQVTIVPDLLTVPTAELAIGLMIGLSRHILPGDRLVRGGGFAGWRPTLYGTGLSGSTVGILGLGRVGRAIAERLGPFGCSLLGCDPGAGTEPPPAGLRPVTFERLLAASDFLVLAAPLTPATVGLFGREALAALKPGAFLVNCARGSLVEEAAVAEALESGRLAGYASDVFAFEDWARPDRPSGIEPRLLAACDTSLLTPHLGSAVTSLRREIELAAARSILAVLRGETPPDCVTGSGEAREPVRP